MKRLFFALLVFTIFIPQGNVKAQCNPDDYASECIPMLAEGFNFVKGYKIDGRGGEREKVEYSYVFTKGTQYMINICGPEGNPGIVIHLFDSKRNQVASSKVNGQIASAIQFPCNATGIYYISYQFQESSKYCGGSALGFSK